MKNSPDSEKLQDKHLRSYQSKKCLLFLTASLFSTIVIVLYLKFDDLNDSEITGNYPEHSERVSSQIISDNATKPSESGSGQDESLPIPPIDVEFQDLSTESHNKKTHDKLKQKLKSDNYKSLAKSAPRSKSTEESLLKISEKDENIAAAGESTFSEQNSVENFQPQEETGKEPTDNLNNHSPKEENVIAVEMPLYNLGEIRNIGVSSLCLDASSAGSSIVTVYACHGQGSNQHWELTENEELRKGSFCADYFGGPIYMFQCHGLKGNQKFIFTSSTQTLYHPSSKTCLTISEGLKLTMKPCDDNNFNQNQQWIWKKEHHYSHTMGNHEL